MSSIHLSDLDFTDLYISEDGRSKIRTLDPENPIAWIPEEAVEDLTRIHQMVCERGLREEGFFISHGPFRYRVAKMETVDGVWYVLRRIPRAIPRLKDLGLPRPLMAHLGKIGRGNGLIIIAGAARNGKTTTAASLLQECLTHYGDIAVTVEDPPEYPLHGEYNDGLGQCFQVKVEKNQFAESLARSLRYSPKYLMIGEILRAEEATAATLHANNGLLVVTTIHGASIEGALDRFVKLSAVNGNLDHERHLLADGLAGIIHQTLAAKPGGGFALELSYLFPGESKGVRTMIREGKTEQLASEIQRQAANVALGKAPDTKSDVATKR
jgi:Tfp pilus assembly pilus retraction ATPase PilT